MKFFNHGGARDKTAPRAKSSNSSATSRAHNSSESPQTDPAPLPEVVEGNEDSDWALWEDSVAFQDSQMQSGFGELKTPEVRESSRNSSDGEHDPFTFESVRRRKS